jgi:ribA/ribD-fused uncharacterized protein
MAILFYKIKDLGGFMSNFYPSKMFIYGRWWKWVEAPYQSAKTVNLEEKELIWNAETARIARDLGQKVSMVHDWDKIKREIMKECCMAKFLQNPDLRQQLIQTGKEELIEDTPHDSFWGNGADGTGQNVLGKVLMEVRDEFSFANFFD